MINLQRIRAISTIAMIIMLPITCVQVSSASATSSPDRPISWLVAGDSYSSGQGLPYKSGGCARAYDEERSAEPGTWGVEAAHLVASQLGVKLINGSPDLVACTGAKTGEFFAPQGINPAEWTGGSYDLVSLTFGGDDVGFPRVVRQCLGYDPAGITSAAVDLLTNVFNDESEALADWTDDPLVHCPSNETLRATISKDIGGTAQGPYGTFLQSVAKKAVTTGGNIIVLGYPEIVEDPTMWPGINKSLGLCQGIRVNDANELRGLAGDLNATIASAVKAVNALHPNDVSLSYVDVNTGNPAQGIPYDDPNLFEPSVGARHNLCSSDQWINGISPSNVAGSFHPDQAGNDAMARLVKQVFPTLNWSKLAVVSSDLAVGTQEGMVLWSDASGATRIGPATPTPVEVYDVNWSADGDYLAWVQRPLSPDESGRAELVEFDVLTHHSTIWSTKDFDLTGIVPSSSGVLTDEYFSSSTTQLLKFNLNGSTTTTSISVPGGDAFVAYGDGFLAASNFPGAEGSNVERVSIDGTVITTPAKLSVVPGNESGLYETAAASEDGEFMADELGDHTDVGGVGPSSKITIVNTISGSVSTTGPPTPKDGSVLRVNSMSWSPSGVLDVTMYNWGASGNARGIPMELWEYSGNEWREIGTEFLAAARGPGGVLATVSGNLKLSSVAESPYAVPAGAQQLDVGGALIPLGAPAQSIAWAP